MNIHHTTSIWHDAALYAQPVGHKRRSRPPGFAKYILFGVFGAVVAIINPAFLALTGIGMSVQNENVTLNGAMASLFAIIFSFFVIRRLLSFPLLRTYGYIALTFVISFCVVGIVLRFFRVDFSGPQFFLGMIIITLMAELFFYAHRQWAPSQIVVVPGVSNVAKLPELLVDAVEFTMLTSVPAVDFNYNGVIADLNS